MILFPAIDLKDGRCVRLKLGEMAQATVFNDDPAAQARAVRGPGLLTTCTSSISTAPSPASRSTRRRSRPSCGRRPCRCSSAAASATLDTIETWLGKGVAPRDPGHRCGARSRRSCARPAGGSPAAWRSASTPRAARSPSRAGREASELDAIELARRFEDAGVAAIIYTDIERDGILKGLNLPATAALARAIAIPVIASGGLAGIADIEALLRPEYRISPAPSPAARSTTAAWMPRRPWL